ncbi:MAG: hypothetical protein JXA00_06025 [Candidatus Thermoplasmatota archaeon]|nr:hypothetical protein [Candidatus Thermoplasmatota archaeon]
MKYRRIGLALVIILLSITVLGMQASAHSPRFMRLTYEPETLTVLILHPTFARSIHYVYKIDVEKNGELVTSEDYDSQPRFLFNVYEFSVNATTGDDITVLAYCSLFGNLQRSLTVS